LRVAFGTEPYQQPLAKQLLISPLSRREAELLGLIAAGRSNKEIAAELYISIGTVKRHTVNIFNKLDVKNRTEAVAKARKLGLL
jgi:LuxR family maltose regulon positive regulatory protein